MIREQTVSVVLITHTAIFRGIVSKCSGVLEELKELLVGSPHLLERAFVEGPRELSLAEQQVGAADVVLVDVAHQLLLPSSQVVLTVSVVVLQQNQVVVGREGHHLHEIIREVVLGLPMLHQVGDGYLLVVHEVR